MKRIQTRIEQPVPTQPPEGKHRCNADHDKAFHESVTFAQQCFQDALLRRLQTEGYVGELLCNCTFVIPISVSFECSFCLRSPDFAFIMQGLIVEIDGSAHDGHDVRRARDLTRERDWKLLGFDCLRLPDDVVYFPEKLNRVLDDIMALLRGAENAPDFDRAYSRRRQRISRSRRAYLAIMPPS